MPSSGIRQFVESKNREYERLHRAFEDQFWGNKMALKTSGDFSPEQLTSTKQAMEAWLADPLNLQETLKLQMACGSGDAESDVQALEIFKRTFECYQMQPEAKAVRDEVTSLESVLEQKRNTLKTGYFIFSLFISPYF